MDDNLKKAVDIYFDLFDIMMRYNHKFWRMNSLPISVNHFIVLCTLYSESSDLTIMKLAEYLSISKQQMSPIVNRLLAKGLIEKRCMSEDRRFSQIRISDKGKKFIEEHIYKEKLSLSQWIMKLSGNSMPVSNEELRKFNDSVKVIKGMMAKIFKADNNK